MASELLNPEITIPNGWSCKTLLDCTEDGMISYGIVQPGSHVDNGISVIRVNNFNNGVLNLEPILKVDTKVAENYKRTELKGGEVLLTLVGSTGQVAIAPQTVKGWNVARAIAVIRPKEEVGSEWLKICLQSKECQNFLDVRANTTVQKTINLKDVKELPIIIPPSPIKIFIEDCITSLNNKIELNRQMNATLEAMAQALFKSWFVDFDPVLDNALAAGNPIPDELQSKAAARLAVGDARKPLPAEIQALFPSSFVLTEEMGWIPEGWEDLNLSSLLEIKYGKDHKALNEGTIPVYGSGGLMRYVDSALFSGESILIPRKGTLSNLMYVNETFWTVDTMFYSVPKLENTAKFIFYFLKTFDFNSMNVGSAVPSMTTKVLNELKVIKPSAVILEAFEKYLSTLFQKNKNLQNENK